MRTTTTTLAMFLFVLTITSALGCGSSGAKFACPSLNDNVTWASYGRFNFGSSGDDSTARQCVSNCGWSIFEGHDGGTGDTLQVASPSTAVVFSWAYRNFAGFRVTAGWTGKTDRGAKLGDSIAHFQGLYPHGAS